MISLFQWVGAFVVTFGGLFLALGIVAVAGDWAIRRSNYYWPFLRFYIAELKAKKAAREARRAALSTSQEKSNG